MEEKELKEESTEKVSIDEIKPTDKKNKALYNTKVLAKMAIFIAISFILAKIEFPILPVVPFLKLDFSNVFVLIGGFMFGPLAGMIILICKEILCLIGTTTPVGQFANILISLFFILIPTLWYKYKKGIKVVIISLIVASLVEIFMALLTNRYINFPLYMGEEAGTVFNKYFWFIVLFNVIKCFSVSLLTIMLYKSVKKVLRF